MFCCEFFFLFLVFFPPSFFLLLLIITLYGFVDAIIPCSLVVCVFFKLTEIHIAHVKCHYYTNTGSYVGQF